jgi:KDO2-lipid IV(A) lauroyltransferase
MIYYRIEAALAWLLFLMFRVLPVDWASNLGGFLGRTIGPRLGSSRRAIKHLKAALPDSNHDQIILDHWENMGRVIAEYPHLESIAQKRVTIENPELLQAVFDKNQGGVLIAAHLGNWELNGAVMLLQFGKTLDLTYRAPNNPFVARMIENFRTLKGRLQAFPKSRDSGRKIMNTLKTKGYLGVLVDQKYNEGISIPFFGHPAMTNPIAFQLAQKYQCPLIPVQNIRTKGAHFKIIIHPPIETHQTDGSPRPLEDMIQEMHLMLEGWIRDNPEQWIWMHRRWRNLEQDQKP